MISAILLWANTLILRHVGNLYIPSVYATCACTRINLFGSGISNAVNRNYETSLTSLRGRHHRGGHPVRVVRPCTCGDLCQHRRFGLCANLFEFPERPCNVHPEVHAVPALQNFARIRPYPQRTSGHRDAQYFPLRGDRATLSRTVASYCGRIQPPANHRNLPRGRKYRTLSGTLGRQEARSTVSPPRTRRRVPSAQWTMFSLQSISAPTRSAWLS